MSSEYFRPEEERFIQRMEELFLRAEQKKYFQVTSFLNQREQYILENISHNYPETDLYFNGGGYKNERQRAIIAPKYYQLEKNDFQIQAISIRYAEKFNKLKHSQILGALVNLGIDRNSYGDIITDGHNWQFFVIDTMSELVVEQVKRIGSNSVSLHEINSDQLLLPTDDYELMNIVSRSFRVDSIIASVFNFSRQTGKDLIANGKVTVNWIKTNKTDYFISINDVISVRGYGRVKINEIYGQTQNSKWKLSVSAIKKK